MKVSKRSRRRMDRLRMMKRAQHLLKRMKFPAEYACYWADNMAKCSCFMCRQEETGPRDKRVAIIEECTL